MVEQTPVEICNSIFQPGLARIESVRFPVRVRGSGLSLYKNLSFRDLIIFMDYEIAKGTWTRINKILEYVRVYGLVDSDKVGKALGFKQRAMIAEPVYYLQEEGLISVELATVEKEKRVNGKKYPYVDNPIMLKLAVPISLK